MRTLALVAGIAAVVPMFVTGIAHSSAKPAAKPKATVTVVGDCTRPHSATRFDDITGTLHATGLLHNRIYLLRVEHFDAVQDDERVEFEGRSDAAGKLSLSLPGSDVYLGPWKTGQTLIWQLYPQAGGSAAQSVTGHLVLHKPDCSGKHLIAPPKHVRRTLATTLTPACTMFSTRSKYLGVLVTLSQSHRRASEFYYLEVNGGPGPVSRVRANGTLFIRQPAWDEYNGTYFAAGHSYPWKLWGPKKVVAKGRFKLKPRQC